MRAINTSMIIKNKKTHEELDLTYPEFRKNFKIEIEEAYESFKQTEMADKFYKRQDDNLLECDFYFQLQWNFNHFTNSNWFIQKI